MKHSGKMLIVAAVLVLASTLAFGAKVGEPAPAFAVKDTKGREHKLSDLKGKYVVLEWQNKDCPFVQKHYNSNNMQKLQREWTGKGIVWLTVLSSAPGKQGYLTGAQADAWVAERKAMPTGFLLDASGAMGRAYGAKTTPHVFVIDPKGTLIYNGAIDDKPTTELGDVPPAKNHLAAALTEAMAGKPVSVAATTPYGCSVKY